MKLFYKKATIWIFAAATALTFFAMIPGGRRLRTPATPGGILCLEFANTAQKVKTVLSAWSNSQSIGQTSVIPAAKNNTYLDFVFLFLYSLFLFTCCRQLAASLPGKKAFSLIFNIASLFALIVGLLDIFENFGMLKSLQGNISDQGAMATATFAIIKWILVIGVILLMAGGIAYRHYIKRRDV